MIKCLSLMKGANTKSNMSVFANFLAKTQRTANNCNMKKRIHFYRPLVFFF